MPNHVTSRLTFNCSREEMESVFEKYNTFFEAQAGYSYDGDLRFKEDGENLSYGFLNLKTGEFSVRGEDKKQGVPEGYSVDITPAYNHFPDFNKIKPQPDNIFKGDLSQKDKEECIKKGIPNWYDWNSENWGTKWNSYSFEREAWNIYKFQTAWAGVPELIKKMSYDCRNIEIKYVFADEDSGANTGFFVFKNGVAVKHERPESYSHRGFELFLSLNPDCDYIKLVDGKYEYIEDEEDYE